MSCFIEFVRFILCCYIEEDAYEPINRKGETYHSSPRTLSTPFINQSHAYTAPTRETRSNTSTLTKLPQKLSDSCFTPKVVPNSATKYANSINNEYESASKFSQYGSTSLPKPNQTSSNPTIMSTGPSSSTNTQGTLKYVLDQKATSIPTKLPQKLDESCVVTPNIVPSSATKFKYGNSINNVYESASEFSQYGSSSSPKPHRPSSKPTLMYIAPSISKDTHGKTNYVFVEKATAPTYAIPEDLKSLFTRDVVPMVLKKTVTPSTYKEYFQTLLYAEDFYIEKWNGFVMENVTLELHEAAIYSRGGNRSVKEESDDKIFVAFKMDSVPGRRPFLLSRDFVSVRPSGKETASFQGVIYRVVKSNLVLVEFEEDFHHQHNLLCKYDVKFSFNRVCLKRAHQAISAASDPSIQNFLFPSIPKENTISSPYIIEGPLSVKETTSCIVREPMLSRSGDLIRCNVIRIYRMYPSCRILICAPTNKTCDVITRSLQEEIPDIFRANAAFREVDGVPEEILPNCRYKKECFSCPPLKELRNFKVVVSTFMSAFRLHNEGLTAGHFSHIFLVDASSTTEPEAMVALVNLVDDETKVVVSGRLGNRSSWVRSNIARRHGLMVSFFERIRQSRLYHSLDPKFITKVTDSGQ